MGKQEDFVLRALEERDVRFVRLWFTDVLGYLKSVSVAPAELENAFSEGIGFDGSAIEGFARVQRGRTCSPSPTRPRSRSCRGDARKDGRDRPHVLRYRDARTAAVVRRSALRAQARCCEQAAEQGFTFYTHPEIEFYLLKNMPEAGAEPVPVDRSGFFDHTAQSRGSDFRREAITMLEAMGISVEFSHHEGGPGPAGDRPALRRRAHHSRQHHDLPHRRTRGRAGSGHLGQLHAQALHHAPRIGHAHPRLALRGRP